MTRSSKYFIKTMMACGLDRNTAGKYRRILIDAIQKNDQDEVAMLYLHIRLTTFYLRFCSKSERRSMFGKLDKTIFAELIVPNKSASK